MLRIIECTCIYIGLLQKVITGRTKSTVQLFRGEQSSYVCTTRGTDENSTGEISVTRKKNTYDAWGEKKRLIFISRINLRRKRERAVSPFIVPRGCQEKNANGVARLSRKKISTPAFAGLPVKIKRDEFFVEYREGDLFRDSLRGNTVYLYPRPG